MGQAALVLPTLYEELNRKTFETIEWLVMGLQNGRLTNEQFSMGVDTLFMTVNGLVDKDFIRMVTEAQEQCKDVKPEVKRIFNAPGTAEARFIRWSVGSRKVTTSKREFGLAVGGTIKEFDDAKTAMEFVDRFSSILLKQGWIEL